MVGWRRARCKLVLGLGLGIRRGRVRHRELGLGSSRDYRCRRLVVVGMRMDRWGVDRGFAHREIVGVEVHHREMVSVLVKDLVRRRVVGGFEGGMERFVRSLVREGRRCCLGYIEVVGDMAEVVRHHMVDEVGRDFGFRHRRNLGWTCCLICLLLYCLLLVLYREV